MTQTAINEKVLLYISIFRGNKGNNIDKAFVSVNVLCSPLLKKRGNMFPKKGNT